MRISILGAGLVGGAMARDLADEKNCNVTVADVNPESLKKLEDDARLRLVRADLSKTSEIKRLAAKSDFLIGALPGFMGFRTLKILIEAGKNVVDISFFPENPFELNGLAKRRNATAIVDAGVAPGMSNMLTAHAASLLDETQTCLCYVGGLPKVRTWPYEYKIVFSAMDVIEEYTRPARYIENGRPVVKPALSEPELLDFPGVGTLEAFNTDGLRTLATTLRAPNMKEKTMRYPGHIEKMRVLRDTGFFEKKPIEVRGVKVRPIDLTAKLMFPLWKLGENEEDFTVMRVIVEGLRSKKRVRYTYDLLDNYDTATRTTSMARTTGYTCTVAVRMLARGLFKRKGICPLEYVGRSGQAYQFMMRGLKDRNIHVQETVETV